MGALVGSSCFSSASEATTFVWSGVGPVVQPGSPLVVSTVEYASGAWYSVTRSDGVVTASAVLPALGFAECDPAAQVNDGIALGFAVLGVWAAAWSINVLRRAMSR